MAASAGVRSYSEHYDHDRTGRRVHDPYISDKAFPEPTVCPVCNAVYHKRRWVFDEKLLAEVKKDKTTQFHKCPADKKIEDHYAMGKIRLSGNFVLTHMDEIINSLKGEEIRAKENNPLDRFILLEKTQDKIYAETTSDALAMRIAHHLKNAFKIADEEFKFRSGDKFVEIDWHKD
jgi:hypothetical protein